MTDQDTGDKASLPTVVEPHPPVPAGWAHSFSSWIDLFHSVPGAAAAIAKCFGAIGQAGAAGIGIGTSAAQAKSKNIEVAGEAKDMVYKALAKAAIDRIDPSIADRALNHFASDILDKQENREAVTLKALGHIKDDPKESIAKEAPSEDFFNLFGTFAERASSEKMREHFSMLLAGEIRRPGTFSFATMQMASLLDQQLASNIEYAASYSVMNIFIPQHSFLSEGLGLVKMLSLNGIGFIHMGTLQNQLPVDENGKISLFHDGYWIQGDYTPNSRVAIASYIISETGKQLLQIISPKTAVDYPEFIVGALQAAGVQNVLCRKMTDIFGQAPSSETPTK